VIDWRHFLLSFTVAGLRRSETHLNSTDSEDDWQAVDSVSFTLIALVTAISE